MIKRIIVIILSLFFILCLCSCNNGGKISDDESFDNETFNQPLIGNGEKLSDYKIVVSSDASVCEKYAAEEFRDYIEKAADITIPIITDEISKSCNEIVIGKTNRGICKDVNYSELGEEGYTLKTNDKDLLIGANGKRGVLYGVYSYLEKLGYRFYSRDVEKIPSKKKVFVAKDLYETFVPNLEYRDISYEAAIGGKIATKLKINTAFCQSDLKNDEKYGGSVSYVYNERGFVHTVRYLVSDEYISTHPEFFALWNGKRVNGQWGGHCFSCEELVDVVVSAALLWIKNDPESKTLSISQNDGEVYCQCGKCLENYKKYGTTGVFLQFVNKVAKKIGEVYPDINVEMISYGSTFDPPKDGIIPAKNVSIRLCMPHCDIPQHQDDECDVIRDNKNRYGAWANLTDNMRVYMYRSDYFDWFSVLPNVYSIYDEIKFFTQSDVVKGLYNEGYLAKSGEFGELRTYITAKLMWNPDMSREEFNYHVDDFLKGYYGDGWKEIKEYIQYTEKIASEHTVEIIEQNVKKQEEITEQQGGSYFAPHRYLGDDYMFFPVSSEDFTMFDKWNEFWDKAEEQADEEQLERIKISRVATTFFELSYTMEHKYSLGSSQQKADLVRRNEDLYKTMIKNGITQKADNYFVKTDVKDFTQPPNTWIYKR